MQEWLHVLFIHKFVLPVSSKTHRNQFLHSLLHRLQWDNICKMFSLITTNCTSCRSSNTTDDTVAINHLSLTVFHVVLHYFRWMHLLNQYCLNYILRAKNLEMHLLHLNSMCFHSSSEDQLPHLSTTSRKCRANVLYRKSSLLKSLGFTGRS